MKLKIIELLNAIPAMQKLSAADLSLKCCHQLDKLFEKVDNEITFFNRKLQELQGKYPEAGDEFKEKQSELLNFEIEIDFVRPVIRESENIRISVNDKRFLKEFIDFIYEEANAC